MFEALILGCFSITFMIVFILISDKLIYNKSLITKRLLQYVQISQNDLSNKQNRRSLPFLTRVVGPLMIKLKVFIMAVMPSGMKDKLKKTLLESGLKMDISQFMTIPMLLFMGSTLLIGYCWSQFHVSFLKTLRLFAIVTAIECLGPYLLLRIRCDKRKKSMAKELPFLMDLLMVSVEAGLGFDLALIRVSQKIHGPLAEELKRMIREMKMGKSRDDGLRDLAERLQVDGFKNVVNAIIQGEKLGVGIGNVLRIQAKEMRRLYKQKIEEKAKKAPVKMLLPLIFFIFPTVFVVLLGPAVINIMTVLFNK